MKQTIKQKVIKKGHFMMIKWSVHWEALTLISIHVPNRAPKTSKKKLREKWILFGEFNTLLSIMDTTSRK